MQEKMTTEHEFDSTPILESSTIISHGHTFSALPGGDCTPHLLTAIPRFPFPPSGTGVFFSLDIAYPKGGH